MPGLRDRKELQKPISPMVGKTVFELWLFGGNSNNGSNCGLAYANSNNAWTNANANYSARLTTLRKEIYKGVKYCVIGNHPNTASLGSVCVCIARVGRNNIHLARIVVSHAARDVSKSASHTWSPAARHTLPQMVAA